MIAQRGQPVIVQQPPVSPFWPLQSIAEEQEQEQERAVPVKQNVAPQKDREQLLSRWTNRFWPVVPTHEPMLPPSTDGIIDGDEEEEDALFEKEEKRLLAV